VDVKEPSLGALGFAAPAVITDVVMAIRGNCQFKQQPAIDLPISIAMGELADDPLVWRQRLAEHVWREIRYAKVGCHNCPPEEWLPRWNGWRSALPPHVLPVAVAYADDAVARSPQPEYVLDRAIVGGAAGYLIDTFAKKSSHLFDFFSVSRLDSLIHRAHRFQVLVAVAGSMQIRDLTRALATNLDIVGVRGAACEGDRNGTLSARNVQRLARAIDQIETEKSVSRLVRHARC
jgi:uncharacterized protein (UPF0264 family)